MWRPVLVWVVVTAATVAAVRATPAAIASAREASGSDRPVEAVVAVSTTVLALGLLGLWLVTCSTVRDVLGGQPMPRPGAARRLVLLACGVAVVAGTAGPALADPGDRTGQLAGLPFPDRASAPRLPSPAADHDDGGHDGGHAGRGDRSPSAVPTVLALPDGTRYVVRRGDSLWAIARAHPGPPGTTVEARWRAIWAANRGVVGPDPDLIHPGQALRLPGTTPDEDGARR